MNRYSESGQVNTMIAIGVVVAVVLGLGALGIIDIPGITPGGDSSVKLGIVTASGQEKYIDETGLTGETFYIVDTDGDRVYLDEDDTGPQGGGSAIESGADYITYNGEEITEIFGDLYVKAETAGVGADVELEISYNITIDGSSVKSGSLSKTIQSGEKVKVTTVSITQYRLLEAITAGEEETVEFTYSITGKHDGATVDKEVSGTMIVKHAEGEASLSISASIEPGTAMIFDQS